VDALTPKVFWGTPSGTKAQVGQSHEKSNWEV